MNFLICWEGDFLVSWSPALGEPEWTRVPSKAAHFSYRDADAMAQNLQALGLKAYVTDVYGVPATVDVIREQEAYEGGPDVVHANEPE